MSTEVSHRNDTMERMLFPSKFVPLAGATLSKGDVVRILKRIESLVYEQGKIEVAAAHKPLEMSDGDWQEYKQAALNRAFAITTTVFGTDGKKAYVPSIENIFSDTTPDPLIGLTATNKMAYAAFTNANTNNNFKLELDFSSPPIVDSENPLSSPTPNRSNIEINGVTETWIAAVESAVTEELTKNKNRRGWLHWQFIYDAGLFFFAMPAGIFACHAAKVTFPTQFSNLGTTLEIAVFIYLFLVSIFLFRVSFGYVRWLFPKMELLNDQSSRSAHRRFLKWIVGGLLIAGVSSLFF